MEGLTRRLERVSCFRSFASVDGIDANAASSEGASTFTIAALAFLQY